MRYDSREDLTNCQKSFQDQLEGQKKKIYVCGGTGCVASGAFDIYRKFKEVLANRKIPCQVELKEESTEERVGLKISGCHGFCEKGPLVAMEPSGILYVKVQPEDVEEIIEQSILRDEVVSRLVFEKDGIRYPIQEELPFYRSQQRRILQYCGRIDADSMEEYIAYGGYQALEACLFEHTSEDVIRIIQESSLRGRGGGGFGTGMKWNYVKNQNESEKYVVCNGDEGDPGAFMDRSIMEGDPHRVLEGMMIAGYAVGASQGYIYIRAEYPLAVARLQRAIEEARKAGMLGEGIMGTDFSFDIEIRYGAGAFVCGEETSLIRSIEGERGEPVNKPPFPAESGLWEKPTLVNNVETFANVALIISKGSDWYRSCGTDMSPGTKVFALTGNIENTGLIEVPMGTPLHEIIYSVGGGIKGGKKFKAVQIGGPSGGCLTEEHLNMPLDYESLREAGAMIGSGGLVVMDEDTCIVEVAKFFMNFTQNESCGKCTPCRIGNKRLYEILERITEGKGTLADLKKLKELSEAVKDTALCGLGQTSPNPVLSTLEYFYEEYCEHVLEKKCRAGSCSALLSYFILEDKCTGCTLCARKCPVSCIEGSPKKLHVIDQEKCIKCGACLDVCRFDAVVKK